jgi:uncharacterized protein YjeT (DUF2065 family)
MRDFLTALALILVIEGVIYAAFPEAMKRLMTTVLDSQEDTLRKAGIAAALTGLVCVWLLRG